MIDSVSRRLLVAVLFVPLPPMAVAPAGDAAGIGYPQAKRVDVVDTYHGDDVTDPYQWMEAGVSDDLETWLASQSGLTETWFDDAIWRRTRQRVQALESFSQRNAPVRRGERFFYAQFPSVATDKTSVFFRQGEDGASRALIAPPYHYAAAVDTDLIRFNGFMPSMDGKHLAYVTSGDGSVWHRVRFVDVASGELLDDELRGLNRISAAVSWGAEGKRVYYVRFDEPADADKLSAPVRNGRVFVHELGQAQSEDELLYAPTDPELVPNVTVSLDGDYAVIHVLDPRTQNIRVFIAGAGRESPAAQELFRGRPARYTYIDNDGSLFWFYSSEGAPNGRIVGLDIATGAESVVVEERREAMSAGSFVGGNALGRFGEQFVVLYMKDGIPVIRAFDLQGRLKYETAVPPGGSVWGGFSGHADDPVLYFGYIGMFDPFAVYRMDARTGEYELYSRSAPAGLDAAHFEVRQVFYESADGTRVPMFLTHKKGVVPDGTVRTFLYGYGAFGWNSFLFYQSHLIAWLQDGGVYAQPGLRGGGEYGQDWHEAGKGINKENTVADFIAAAEWLIENGYADAGSIVANGGSASAMPAAAAIQRRPDLFGAAIIDRPALDMLRFNQFTQGRLWLDEFGAPDTLADYEGLRRLSPYHNLEPGRCYPPTLVMVGDSDPVTPPLHGYKYVARLQHAQGCSNPALLYVMPKTGHTFGSTPAQVIDSRTAMLVFLMQTGVGPE